MLPSPFLSDHQWSLLQPLFPSASRGRPAFDNRLILELIFRKLTSHLPWYDLPSASPSWQTIYQHYHRLQSTYLWKSIFKILLADLNDRGRLNLLTAIENREIQIQRHCSGRLEIAFPSQYENSWQQSTATLLIYLLFSKH